MSASNVKKFMAKVEEKKSLQAKLKAMYNKTMAEGKSKVAAGVVKIAAAEGFKFTVKDLAKAHGAKRKKLPKGVLADVTGQEFCTGNGFYCMSGWYCISQWVTP
jgi:predicted ribosomally synthesized peptide with nif11-like leader